MTWTNLPTIAVFDVDGVLTTGQFLYSIDGKAYKIFGPHDNDGIKLLCQKMRVLFITADQRGFQISRKRVVDDMKQELVLVGETERLEYLETHFGLSNVIYMGDGYHDAAILQRCRYGIAPVSGRVEARKSADYVTPSPAGDGAVLDACLHIVEKFFASGS